MKYIDIEVELKKNVHKLLYRIWKVDNNHFIVWNYYENKIQEVSSRLDIFSILNNCLIIDNAERPKIGTAIITL